MRGFLLAYEGLDESESEIFKKLLEDIESKKPVDFNYHDYDYKAIYNKGEARFAHAEFNYDINKKSLVDAREFDRRRLQKFPEQMQRRLKGNVDQIHRVHELLKENAVNPSRRVNITIGGTSGNGKTEFLKRWPSRAMVARMPWKRLHFMEMRGSSITFFDRVLDMWDQMNQQNLSYGWSIELRGERGELLSWMNCFLFMDLLQREWPEKLKLLIDFTTFWMSASCSLQIKSTMFLNLLWGSLVMPFKIFFINIGDTPDGEKLVAKTIKDLTRQKILQYFQQMMNMDAAKMARMGLIMVNGPLPRSTAREVGSRILEDNIGQLQKYQRVEVAVPAKIVDEIVEKLTTIQLGMREVDMGISQIVMSATNGIVFDLPETKKIEGRVVRGKIRWYADDKEVVLAGQVVNKNSGLENLRWMPLAQAKKEGLKVRTRGFEDLDIPLKKELSEINRPLVAIHEAKGHWQLRTLLMGKILPKPLALFPPGRLTVLSAVSSTKRLSSTPPSPLY